MRQLKLVETAEIVQFPKVSTFDDAWALRKGQMRTRGDGREKTRKLWDKAAGKVGSARLLEALRRYLREEKEPTCGYPGLSVWLNGERYDHWTCIEIAENLTHQEERVKLPEPFRASLVASCGEGWVISYLDQCTVDGTVLVVPKGKATAWSRIDEKRNAMKAAGLTARRWGD